MDKMVVLLLIVIFPLITESIRAFQFDHTNRSVNNQCCASAKMNVAAVKANDGRTFFRRLSTDADSHKEINAENMCNLIHFLNQQASLNGQSVTFTKGMFVIFDSKNQIFGRLMKAKDEQKSGDDGQYAGYVKRLKHVSAEGLNQLLGKSKAKSDLISSDTFIYVRGDESSHYHDERGTKESRTRDYPAYGMDIPDACMPSGFGHILFGRLPSSHSDDRYAGERIYIKPEFFGIRELKQFVQHGKSYFDHLSKHYVCQLKEMKNQPDCSAEEAFRENIDKTILEKWRKILSTISSISKRQEEFMTNATKYGIAEIHRQANKLEAIDQNNNDIREFHQTMIKKYGQNDINVRKGREIIFTSQQLLNSSMTCELSSHINKCSVNEKINK